MIEIKLTKSQVENLLSFFELEFIPSIQRDEAIDNIGYVVEMCEVYRMLRDGLAGKGGAKMDGGKM